MTSKQNHHNNRIDSHDDYITKVILGNGGLGSVFHVESPKFPRRYFAKKCVQTNCKERARRVQRECRILAKLNMAYDHPDYKRHRVVTARLHEVIQTSNYCSLVLTLAPLGDLASYLKFKSSVALNTMVFMLSELIVAMEFIHHNCILHRDIKPENILIDAKRHLLLTDFDLSIDMEQNPDHASGVCGTLEYMAPEVAVSNQSETTYSYPADIFSLGMTMLSTICRNKDAFRTAQLHETLMNGALKDLACRGKYHFSGLAATNADCKALLKEMLQFCPTKRATLNQIKSTPLFKNVDFGRVERGEIKAPIY